MSYCLLYPLSANAFFSAPLPVPAQSSRPSPLCPDGPQPRTDLLVRLCGIVEHTYGPRVLASEGREHQATSCLLSQQENPDNKLICPSRIVSYWNLSTEKCSWRRLSPARHCRQKLSDNRWGTVSWRKAPRGKACEPPLQARSKAGTVPQDQASFSCLSRLGGPGGSQKLSMSERGGPGRAKGRREAVDPTGYHSLRPSGAETRGRGADKRRQDKLQLCALSRTAQHQAPNASSQGLLAPPQSPVPQVPTPPLLDVEVSPGSLPWVVSPTPSSSPRTSKTKPSSHP